MSLKIALIGCCGMANAYAHRYTQIPGAELALLVDTREEAVKKMAERLGVTGWSANFEDCLRDDIDIVDISTPNHLHHSQAIAAINAGKHVLMQKPLASTTKEAEDIVAAAAAKGVTAGMYMAMFDNPLYYDIKKMTGKIGRISAMHCRSAHTGGLDMPPGTWRGSLEQTGGGSFIQLTVHTMNLAQWLLGDRISSVMAYSKNIMCPNIGGDDVTAVACEFGSGILGTMSSAYCADREELTIYGSEGSISVEGSRHITIRLNAAFEGEVINYQNPNKRETVSLPYHSNSLYSGQNSRDQHIAFVEAVRDGRPPFMPLSAGLHDMKVVKAIYDSAASGERRMV